MLRSAVAATRRDAVWYRSELRVAMSFIRNIHLLTHCKKFSAGKKGGKQRRKERQNFSEIRRARAVPRRGTEAPQERASSGPGPRYLGVRSAGSGGTPRAGVRAGAGPARAEGNPAVGRGRKTSAALRATTAPSAAGYGPRAGGGPVRGGRREREREGGSNGGREPPRSPAGVGTKGLSCAAPAPLPPLRSLRPLVLVG